MKLFNRPKPPAFSTLNLDSDGKAQLVHLLERIECLRNQLQTFSMSAIMDIEVIEQAVAKVLSNAQTDHSPQTSPPQAPPPS